MICIPKDGVCLRGPNLINRGNALSAECVFGFLRYFAVFYSTHCTLLVTATYFKVVRSNNEGQWRVTVLRQMPLVSCILLPLLFLTFLVAVSVVCRFPEASAGSLHHNFGDFGTSIHSFAHCIYVTTFLVRDCIWYMQPSNYQKIIRQFFSQVCASQQSHNTILQPYGYILQLYTYCSHMAIHASLKLVNFAACSHDAAGILKTSIETQLASGGRT